MADSPKDKTRPIKNLYSWVWAARMWDMKYAADITLPVLSLPENVKITKTKRRRRATPKSHLRF